MWIMLTANMKYDGELR